MAELKDHLEIKFWLKDSYIGPQSFPDATTAATLKETIVAQWPKEKEFWPKTVKDLILISGATILENNKTVGHCRSYVCNLSGSVTTMHFIIRPQVTVKEKRRRRTTTNVSVYVLEICSNDE